MQTTADRIKELFTAFSKDAITGFDKLPQAGSERHYFRIHTAGKTYIATYGANIKENDSFIYFSEHFKMKGLTTAKILAINKEKDIYIQEDFGDVSLLNKLEEQGYVQPVYDLYKESLRQLALLQVKGHEELNYKKCLTNTSFGKQAIMADLLYFKYYFLDALRRPYDKQKLIDDFEALSNYLAHTEYKFFMFRDFQSRNIMVTPSFGEGEGEVVHFIDYQGGMKGAPQYDVASLLWQAKANLPDDWKLRLLEDYINSFETIVEETVDRDVFRSQYNGYVLIRLLQVLGAYGFRGLFERKAHFLTSIPLALKNLRAFLLHHKMGISVPEFDRILTLIVDDEIIHRFEPIKATEETPLVVNIKSFSFLKSGYPKNVSDNGGGFVFDCRGILNPGRVEAHKKETGRDKPVQDYLADHTRMEEFLAGVFSTVDISVEDYLKRNFEVLEVNFGCTGGQHRSVYAADALARHLKNKYGVKTVVKHIEQNFEEAV